MGIFATFLCAAPLYLNGNFIADNHRTFEIEPITDLYPVLVLDGQVMGNITRSDCGFVWWVETMEPELAYYGEGVLGITTPAMMKDGFE